MDLSGRAAAFPASSGAVTVHNLLATTVSTVLLVADAPYCFLHRLMVPLLESHSIKEWFRRSW